MISPGDIIAEELATPEGRNLKEQGAPIALPFHIVHCWPRERERWSAARRGDEAKYEMPDL
jgi:hypothetical protein